MISWVFDDHRNSLVRLQNGFLVGNMLEHLIRTRLLLANVVLVRLRWVSLLISDSLKSVFVRSNQRFGVRSLRSARWLISRLDIIIIIRHLILIGAISLNLRLSLVTAGIPRAWLILSLCLYLIAIPRTRARRLILELRLVVSIILIVLRCVIIDARLIIFGDSIIQRSSVAHLSNFLITIVNIFVSCRVTVYAAWSRGWVFEARSAPELRNDSDTRLRFGWPKWKIERKQKAMKENRKRKTHKTCFSIHGRKKITWKLLSRPLGVTNHHLTVKFPSGVSFSVSGVQHNARDAIKIEVLTRSKRRQEF